MGTITTLRPSATSSGVGWSAEPSGTLHGVTSDDSDSTYALWSGDGSALILATPADSPPAGERRHQVRLRARGEDGNAWWAVRLASGSLVAGAAAQFTSSPSTITGSWGFGVPATGSTILSTYVTGQSTGVAIEELYLDVDTREAPTFTAQVLDGSGTDTTTVSDTSTPTIIASAVDLDGLSARQYRYWVTLNGAIVWDTGTVSGAAVGRTTTPLDNGTYVAHYLVTSTLGANTAYDSDESTVEFTVSVGTVPEPNDLAVSQVPDTPFYTVQACAPDVDDLDDYVGYIEVQRVDCPSAGYLSLPGSGDAYASTPDPGSVTDLQLVVEAQRSDAWFPTAEEALVAQFDTTGDDRSWMLTLDTDGLLNLTWSEDGTSSMLSAVATDRAPVDPYGVVRVRVRLDVDDDSGGWDVTFESPYEPDGPWLPVGETVSNDGGGTTALYDSSAPLTVGAYLDGSVSGQWSGRVHTVSVSDGVGGTVIASPDFTVEHSGTIEFEDDQANVWTISSPAAIVSETSTVSLAVLGPLATDECAEWTDFTMPRMGQGRTCDHDPALCCSYYRVRTVGRSDGALVISDWADGSGLDTFCLEWSDDEHLIRSTDADGPMWVPVLGRFAWDVDRPFTTAIGVSGTRFVTSSSPGGRNLKMAAAVESEADLADLREILSRPLVLVSPSDSSEVWAAPVSESVQVVKVGRIRSITANFIGTGPEPGPQLSDVGS